MLGKKFGGNNCYHRDFSINMVNIILKGLSFNFYIMKKITTKNLYIGHCVNLFARIFIADSL